MSDPIYAVGSFYVSGQVYPKKSVVEDALHNLTRDLDQSKCMLKGEVVWVERGGRKVSLREFAGYTDEQLEENISDLSEIVSELTRFMTEDYTCPYGCEGFVSTADKCDDCNEKE
jgi:hypothetical protein